MTITTSYRRHLRKTIACCLLLMPCHAADTIELNIKTLRKQHKIKIATLATVEDLKKKIQAEQYIDLKYQKIIFAGQECFNHERLQDRGISDQSTIHLMWSRLLHIEDNTKKMDIVVKPSATIGDVKDAIAAQGNTYTRQKLILHYNNNTILEDAHTLQHYDIKPTDTVQLLTLADPLTTNNNDLNTNPNINLINPSNANTTHASDTTNNNHLTTPPNDPKKYILPIAALVVTLCLIGMVISPFSADHEEASPHTQRPPKKTSPPSQKRKKNTPSRKKRTPKTT